MKERERKMTDGQVKKALLGWAEAKKPLFSISAHSSPPWFQGQPPEKRGVVGPRIILAGDSWKHGAITQPDGLWARLYGMEYADVICIEACGTQQNLWDKRARYAANTQARLLYCKPGWLRKYEKQKPKGFKKIRLGLRAGDSAHRIPIRHLSVLYVLPGATAKDLYWKQQKGRVLGGHEYCCSLDALRRIDDPGFREFLQRLIPGAHYYNLPNR